MFDTRMKSTTALQAVCLRLCASLVGLEKVLEGSGIVRDAVSILKHAGDSADKLQIHYREFGIVAMHQSIPRSSQAAYDASS
jgi:hypothetical protein